MCSWGRARRRRARCRGSCSITSAAPTFVRSLSFGIIVSVTSVLVAGIVGVDQTLAVLVGGGPSHIVSLVPSFGEELVDALAPPLLVQAATAAFTVGLDGDQARRAETAAAGRHGRPVCARCHVCSFGLPSDPVGPEAYRVLIAHGCGFRTVEAKSIHAFNRTCEQSRNSGILRKYSRSSYRHGTFRKEFRHGPFHRKKQCHRHRCRSPGGGLPGTV